MNYEEANHILVDMAYSGGFTEKERQALMLGAKATKLRVGAKPLTEKKAKNGNTYPGMFCPECGAMLLYYISVGPKHCCPNCGKEILQDVK